MFIHVHCGVHYNTFEIGKQKMTTKTQYNEKSVTFPTKNTSSVIMQTILPLNRRRLTLAHSEVAPTELFSSRIEVLDFVPT